MIPWPNALCLTFGVMIIALCVTLIIINPGGVDKDALVIGDVLLLTASGIAIFAGLTAE